MKSSRPSDRSLAVFLVLVLAVICVRTVVYRDLPWFIEATIYFAIFCALFRHRAFYVAFRHTPMGYRLLAGVLVTAALIGQFANAPWRTYPFVNWDLYSNLTFHQSTYLHFMARMEDGSESTLPITNLPLPRTRLDRRLHQLVVQSGAGTPNAHRAQHLLHQSLQSLAALYHQSAPGKPRIRTVILYQYHIPLTNYRGTSSITRTTVAQIDL